MKIINFDEFLPFKKIRKKLEIPDDYKANFESYHATIEQINWEKIKTEGLDISIEDLVIAEDGTLEHKDYKNQKMIVYIRDWYINTKYEAKAPKFHITWCQALKQMHERGRSDRYVVSQRTDGLFKVNRIEDKILKETKDEKLDVCKYCLSKLNYKGYAKSYNKKTEIFNNFKISEFLKEYNTEIIIEPKYNSNNQPLSVYPKNWDEISRKYRESKNWICEDCGKDMKYNKRNLHVHHIDGIRSNHNPSNLIAVCHECHTKKPMHGHMNGNRMFNR